MNKKYTLVTAATLIGTLSVFPALAQLELSPAKPSVEIQQIESSEAAVNINNEYRMSNTWSKPECVENHSDVAVNINNEYQTTGDCPTQGSDAAVNINNEY